MKRDAAEVGLNRWLLAALLLIAGAGAAACSALPRPTPRTVPSLGIALTAVLTATCAAATAAGVVFVVRRRWHRREPDNVPDAESPPPPALARIVLSLVALALVVAPAVLAAVALREESSGGTGNDSVPTGPAAPNAQGTSHASTTNDRSPSTTTGSSTDVAVVIGAVAAVTVIVLVRRRRTLPEPAAPKDGSTQSTREVLGSSIMDGLAALRDESRPREAVIASYAAMEARLADSGLPPSRARTPSELVAQAVSDELAPQDQAVRLTRLFERARFSLEPVSEQDRADAHASMLAIGDRLEKRRGSSGGTAR